MRRLDHQGMWMETPDGTTTCTGSDGLTHRLFAADQDVLMQALTRCGRRALAVPGVGDINCPEAECQEY